MLIPLQEKLQGADWTHSNQRGGQQPFGTKVNQKKVSPKLLSEHYPFLPEGASILGDKEKFLWAKLKQKSPDPMFRFSKFLNNGHKIADNGTANSTSIANTTTAEQNSKSPNYLLFYVSVTFWLPKTLKVCLIECRL